MKPKYTIQDDLRKLRRDINSFNETASRVMKYFDLKGDEIGYCKQPKILLIQEVVASHYQLPISVMNSRIRTREFVQARHVAMYFARELTSYTLHAIGECFGRDHGTVLQASARIAGFIHNNATLSNELAGLRSSLEMKLKNIETPLLAFTA